MPTPLGMQANLFQDGWEEAARKLYRRVRGWNVPMAVRIDADGLLFVSYAIARGRPSEELIGTYTNAAQINEIEDDLIAYLRELTGQKLRRMAA